jgi:hypothetical protein
MSTLVVYLILLLTQLNLALSSKNEWNYKFSFTKQINSQVTIDCGLADQIWIGWSHYGTRNVNNNVASANSNNAKSRLNQEVNLNYL